MYAHTLLSCTCTHAHRHASGSHACSHYPMHARPVNSHSHTEAISSPGHRHTPWAPWTAPSTGSAIPRAVWTGHRSHERLKDKLPMGYPLRGSPHSSSFPPPTSPALPPCLLPGPGPTPVSEAPTRAGWVRRPGLTHCLRAWFLLLKYKMSFFLMAWFLGGRGPSVPTPRVPGPPHLSSHAHEAARSLAQKSLGLRPHGDLTQRTGQQVCPCDYRALSSEKDPERTVKEGKTEKDKER